MRKEVKLGDILDYEQPNSYIVRNSNYDKKFVTPVLTAGQSFILGYTNEKENIFKAKENPVIIFDDFTTASKYVDFDFKVKSSAMKILKPKEGINIKYVYYAIQNIKFDNQLHKRYWISEYSKIKLLIPDIKIQEKIVKELDLINKLINYKRKQEELLDDFIKSQFVEMFGEISKSKYEKVKLSSIAEVKSSHRVFTKEFVEKGIPFYRGTEIGMLSNGEKINKSYYISVEHYQKICDENTKPKKGDLLLPSICDKGQVWMVDTENPFYYKDGRVLLISLRDDNINRIYFHQFMKYKTVEEYIKLGTGSTFAEYKIYILKDFEVTIPPSTLQNQFSEIVKQIDKQKFEIEKSLKETQELYESLMEKYFG